MKYLHPSSKSKGHERSQDVIMKHMHIFFSNKNVALVNSNAGTDRSIGDFTHSIVL